jgi:DNA invertase Pin-like site-specific DNA recombinase
MFRQSWEKRKLISTSEPIDISSGGGRLMFKLKMAPSCYMPEDMREKQRIGVERAKREGKYRGGVKGRTWS